MRKSDLHPDLQASCVPIEGRSGCFAVVPRPVQPYLHLPSCHILLGLAQRELAALSETIGKKPEHADLLLHMLNRREAVDSSQIEGTHTGFDGLLIHEIEAHQGEPSLDKDADTTLGYVRAFTYGCRQIGLHGQKALDLPLIRALHAQIMAGEDRAHPGRWREIQNFIGLRMETARFIPPPPDRVPALMENLHQLLQYAPEDNRVVSILMRAAIAHVQFEAIHPFLDGNGRTGRLLLPLMFKAEAAPPIHLASFLKLRQQGYYEALWQAQTRLNWAPWMSLFLECVIASCRHTVLLFDQLDNIKARWQSMLAAQGKRRHATIWRIAGLLLGQPVVTVNSAASHLGVTFPAANGAITELVALDILRPAREQRRNRVFHAHEVMNVLYAGMDDVIDDVSRLSNIDMPKGAYSG